ncbi:hypothetical protein E9531_04410 [Lampropedia puyangensis]|uniref:DUF2399 domain-containing protein n=1 Tax=Lampropedia puyangensis TaxID=1330072 RepID=A0A4S8F904_9BURK|nr:hypothetical protein [Lampropedia puyangensis]THU03980.1 hypothetical protein E9531_04410 [Lampropedia puyangensis]
MNPPSTLQIESTKRNKRKRWLDAPAPQRLWLILQEDLQLLVAWCKDDALTRKRQSLLALAGATGIEHAEALCERLLREGWVERKESLIGGVWQWDAIVWRDLPTLKQLLGLSSKEQRQNARSQVLAVHRAQVLAFKDQVSAELLKMAEQALETVGATAIAFDVLERRLNLLVAVLRWHRQGAQGSRRDFSLFATQAQTINTTKAISTADWLWLEHVFPLQALGVNSFMPLWWMGGQACLHWPSEMTSNAQSLSLGMLAFASLPTADIRRAMQLQTSASYWWLIENRASFERQCMLRAQADPFAGEYFADGMPLLVFMPGRVSTDWQATMRHLLKLAPLPLRISVDLDPAGLEMAHHISPLWIERGLNWQCKHMDAVMLQTAKQHWPLNAYDLAVIERLENNVQVPDVLKTLGQAMRASGRKLEQEGWL